MPSATPWWTWCSGHLHCVFLGALWQWALLWWMGFAPTRPCSSGAWCQKGHRGCRVGNITITTKWSCLVGISVQTGGGLTDLQNAAAVFGNLATCCRNYVQWCVPIALLAACKNLAAISGAPMPEHVVDKQIGFEVIDFCREEAPIASCNTCRPCTAQRKHSEIGRSFSWSVTGTSIWSPSPISIFKKLSEEFLGLDADIFNGEPKKVNIGWRILPYKNK